MIRFATLYSGSSGNSSVIWDEHHSLLVDLGGSCRRTVTALNSLGLAASGLCGVLITHEHSDHIGGIKIFCRHYNVPLYGTEQTERYLRRNGIIPDDMPFHVIAAGESFLLGGFTVTPFATSHDSDSCLGYRIEKAGRSIAVATDLGQVDERVFAALCGCGTVALECNYDRTMLQYGPYPPFLKSRIAANSGHLSNDACARTAVRLAQCGTRQLMLMHLSKENNDPSIALTCLGSEFENAGLAADCCLVAAAPRSDVGPVWEV
ncbi:MAG: MBL fold metallo-hydrolase [Oscillospiraceae bacterium]|nr:MBL fold metallo-hydrolase [Oscillospiraceae bacterium]